MQSRMPVLQYRPHRPALTGRPSIPETLALNRGAAAYWIIRWSLSSGGAPRRPGGG
jgi:hypothetical protein